jgi:hypothetical protein
MRSPAKQPAEGTPTRLRGRGSTAQLRERGSDLAVFVPLVVSLVSSSGVQVQAVGSGRRISEVEAACGVEGVFG